MQFWNRTATCAIASALAVGATAGCETVQDNKRATGTAIGAGAGALAGSAIAGEGNKTEGAVIGGVAGAAGGWIVGDQVDKNDGNNRNDRARDRRRAADRYDRYD